MILPLQPQNSSAEIAQLVEHDLAKVGVASSSLVFRSTLNIPMQYVGIFLYANCPSGGIGRHEGLKILWPLRLCRFEPGLGYKKNRPGRFFCDHISAIGLIDGSCQLA